MQDDLKLIIELTTEDQSSNYLVREVQDGLLLVNYYDRTEKIKIPKKLYMHKINQSNRVYIYWDKLFYLTIYLDPDQRLEEIKQQQDVYDLFKKYCKNDPLKLPSKMIIEKTKFDMQMRKMEINKEFDDKRDRLNERRNKQVTNADPSTCQHRRYKRRYNKFAFIVFLFIFFPISILIYFTAPKVCTNCGKVL